MGIINDLVCLVGYLCILFVGGLVTAIGIFGGKITFNVKVNNWRNRDDTDSP